MRGNGLGVTGRFGIFCLLLGTAFLATAEEPLTAHQQMDKVRADWIMAGKPSTKSDGGESPDFGVDSMTALEVQSFAFQAEDSIDRVCDDSNGYRLFCATPGDPYMGAAVQLPSGVVIDFLKLSGWEINAGDIELALYDNGVAGAAPALIGSLIPTDTGYFNASASLNYTYAQSAHHPLYLEVSFPQWFNRKFNNAQIYYHRIVSPAPASASFNDVPTNHPFFQYIEALKASGITGGCQASPPLYCPDAPLTRGQMAVFLAKALGLHWPY